MALLDIDGTLVNSRGNLSIRTIDTIHKIQKNGIITALCTGRNIPKMLPIAKKLNITVPVACIDGTFLFDPVSCVISNDLYLSEKEVTEILSCGIHLDAFIEINNGYQYYKYIKNKSLYRFDLYNKHTIFGRMKSFLGNVRYPKSIDFVYKVPGNIYQVVFAAEKEVIEQIHENILNLCLKNIEIRDSIIDGFLFVNRKGIKKSRGMNLLCQQYSVHPQEVLAIGDENNDIDMLESAGIGIAMGNASSFVKSFADDITLTNEEDGAAITLEKYFL